MAVVCYICYVPFIACNSSGTMEIVEKVYKLIVSIFFSFARIYYLFYSYVIYHSNSSTVKGVTKLNTSRIVNRDANYQIWHWLSKLLGTGCLKSLYFDGRRAQATRTVDMIRQEISRLWLCQEGRWLVAFWCTWLQDNESFLASTTYQSLPCHNTIDRDHSWMRREWRRAATVRLRRDPLYSQL